MPQKSQETIRRFPRLTNASQAAAFAEMLWGTPEVRIQFRKQSSVNQFIFSVAVPPQFKKDYASAYRMIFKNFDWESALRKAYEEDRYGGKQISAYISVGLHKAFIGAMRRWRLTVRALAHEGDGVSARELDLKFLGDFETGPRGKTGPQPNPIVAHDAAKRFADLLPKVSQLRRDFRSRKGLARRRDLQTAVKGLVQLEDVRNALSEIFNERGRIDLQQLLTPRLSNHDLTYGIVQAELERKGHDLQKISIRTYVRLGRNLMQLASGLLTAMPIKSHGPR